MLEKHHARIVTESGDDSQYLKPFEVELDARGESVPLVFAEAQGSVFRQCESGREIRGGGKRGTVKGFSTASRKNLIDEFNRLGLRDYFDVHKVAVFLTLTYPENFPLAREAKDKHLKRLLARMAYHYPEASAIWRLEFQERGAPHFHLVFFGLPYVDKYEICRVWMECIVEYLGEERQAALRSAEVIPPELRVFTRIEAIRSPRRIISYVSKYLAKVDGDSGFNYAAYLQKNPDGIGRLWGKHNAQHLPVAPRLVFVFPSTDAAFRLRRWARRFRRGFGPKRGRSFTLYLQDPLKWMVAAAAQMGTPIRIYGDIDAFLDSS